MVGVSYGVYIYNMGDAQSMALIAPVRAWRRALPASDVEGKGGETPCRQGEFERPGFEIACRQAISERSPFKIACREAKLNGAPSKIACRQGNQKAACV